MPTDETKNNQPDESPSSELSDTDLAILTQARDILDAERSEEVGASVREIIGATANLVETEDKEGRQPMRFYMTERSSGSKLYLDNSPTATIFLEGNIQSEQETDVFDDDLDVIKKFIEGLDNDNRTKSLLERGDYGPGTQLGYLGGKEDPEGKVITVSGEVRNDSLTRFAFRLDANNESTEDDVSDAPRTIYMVTDSKTGTHTLHVIFPQGNYKLPINDARNPRNWNDERVYEYMKEYVYPSLGIEAEE